MTGKPRTARIIEAGALTTVQDLGRRGVGHLGVSPSGAADWYSARAANRLVGNADAAATIETTMSGVAFVVHGATWLAVTGADARLNIGGRDRELWRAHHAKAGERIVIGAARRGLRSYVAFDGGVIVPLVFESASTDVTSGFGGAVLRAGSEIELGESADDGFNARIAPIAWDANAMLRVAWRAPGLVADALFGQTFTVGHRSSRQALVLEGGAPIAAVRSDLPSGGVCAGCVQVTSDGTPIVLLCEHQTTGGYEIAAVVAFADLPVAGQLRAGEHARFVDSGIDAATRALEARRAALSNAADGRRGEADALARGFFEGVES